ncbi:HIRAN domain-containing protein [Pseudarthrobacter sp. NPDC055928]|uniref:HIRAN domain-containing protein n=1 Tax=Pseudarthrobacter sp. NPDC055928 TaxID=3345661 RepID=UPI0035DDDDB1
MGIMKKLTGWLKGADHEAEAPEKRAVEPAVVAPEPSREVVIPETLLVPTPAKAALEDSRPAIAEPVAEPKTPGVKKVMLDEAGLSVLDLRELASSRFRIVGSAYWVTDSGRYKHGGNDYLLVREPKNKWDANAVAVYGKGRKVGHLTEAKAAALAPILDELGFGAYRVGGTAPAPNSIRMWVDLPALPKLRAFAKKVTK